jgi:hypothetical protein
MYENFEVLRGSKTTTFSTSHLSTRNLKCDMLWSIYVLNLRFWRDRLGKSLHAFLTDRSREKIGCQNFGKTGDFLGSVRRPLFGSSWKTTCAENAFSIECLCTALGPLSSQNKSPQTLLKSARAVDENSSFLWPLSKFSLSGLRGPQNRMESSFSLHTHTYLWC